MTRNFLTTFVILLCLQIHKVSSVSDAELRRVFQMMKTESEAELQRLPENSKNATRNQVLSFLVLSDTEISEIILIPTERFQVLINRKPADIRKELHVEEYLTNKDSVEVHGEIIALYINDTIKKLLNEFDQVNGQLIPNILVYSHYIPCANVPNIPYSCAEEIGKAATYFSGRFQMYVAFSHIFQYTDAPAAIEFLLDSRIKSVINLASNQLPDLSPHNKATLYFQQELFNCLLNKVTECKDGAEKEAFVAYQINDFTKICAQRMCSIFFGKVSTLGLNCLLHCLIGKEWLPCCKKQAQVKRFVKAVGQCIVDLNNRSGSSAKLQLGMPRAGNLLDKQWIPIDNIEMRSWRDLFLYVTDPGGEEEKLKQSDIVCSEGAPFNGRINAHPLGKAARMISGYPNVKQKERLKGGPTVQNKYQ